MICFDKISSISDIAHRKNNWLLVIDQGTFCLPLHTILNNRSLFPRSTSLGIVILSLFITNTISKLNICFT
jgi:hypothetical protein